MMKIEHSPRDHFVAMIKATLSSTPIGAPIASLIGDYIPSAIERSIQRVLYLIEERLRQLEDRLDYESLNKDEFTELFLTCYQSVIRTQQESKLRAAAGLIVNIILKRDDPEKLSYSELDHYAHCIEQLSSGAIEALAHVYDVANIRRSQSFTFEKVAKKMPNMSPDLIMGLLQELARWNMVYLPGEPTVTIEGYKNYPIRITSLGEKMVEYLLNSELRST